MDNYERFLKAELGLGAGIGVDTETGKKYAGFVLFGVALVLLATVGIPYTDSDAAQRPPSHLVMTVFLIIAVLGAVCIFIFNMSLSTFLAAVSGLLIVLTITSSFRAPSGPTKADSPASSMGKQAGIGFGAAVGIAGIQYFMGKYSGTGNGGIQNERVKQVVQFLIGIAPVMMWGALAFGTFRGIQAMLEYRKAATKNTCAGTSATTTPAAVAPYESFQNQDTTTSPPPTDLQGRLRAAIQRIQQSLESIVELTDGTCAIVKETEDGYVGSKSAPPDESEYNLSPEMQESRKQARQASARKTYTSLRKVNASAKGVGILECFQDNQDEDTIRELCIELAGLMENTESVTQIGRMRIMEAELAFAERQLSRVTEAFQDAATSPTVAPPSPSVYYGSLSGRALEVAATNLLAKESELYNSITQLQQILNRLRGQMNRVYSKAGMVGSGNYDFAGTAGTPA
jgi:hypothetical protein